MPNVAGKNIHTLKKGMAAAKKAAKKTGMPMEVKDKLSKYKKKK